ncbi:GMC oxidoreductase [Laetiporus sulphureus 93-53]|uniref:GMC oxidoreductase n=1 Tax=Laetiporus sulphureus 93-53 TaxID=1314785 RepID=A0A165AYT9_9APHY|nr:GMC oxidoreductase [Laetiporus sulphureus 93-53]KZS99912.1 GMC oxidoreductase [Laetiporus sulphureus 93-53]
MIREETGHKPDWKSYDYVVVGGGTAGCVVASRLSEDPSVTVLLVEAGNSHENVFLSKLPLGFAQLFKGSYDWQYETTYDYLLSQQAHFFIYWPRGKILGGTSATNALIYHECAPQDFDAWVKQGAVGWSYEVMKRCFQKAETYIFDQQSPIGPSDHGLSGPWKHRGVPAAPICWKVIAACENMGIRRLTDMNTAEGTLGAGPFTACMDEKHRRSSTATAYLTAHVLDRPNLTVAVGITTEKIHFTTTSDGGHKASGIQIASQRGATQYRVGARKEVILCAGAIGSPQLLMVSGIGSAAHLRDMGIPLVRDLPAVGQNLLDHFSAGAMVFKAKPGTTSDFLLKPFYGLIALLQWLIYGTGGMAALANQVGVFIRADDERLPFDAAGQQAPPTSDLSSEPDAPDIEFVVAPFAVLENGFKKPPFGTYGITVGAVLLKPQSSGTVILRSDSIWDYPSINANYLSAETDMNIMLKAVRFFMRLARTEPLASDLNLGRPAEMIPFDEFWVSNADTDTVSDDDLKAWIRKYGQSAWHPVCRNDTSSAKMGSSPVDSVVDSRLRVHGINGLRVVDTSVFLDQVSGHPCAVVVAVAERAAELIAGND